MSFETDMVDSSARVPRQSVLVLWMPRTEKEANNPGTFRPEVFFILFCGEITSLPLRTPRGVRFNQECLYAPRGVLEG